MSDLTDVEGFEDLVAQACQRPPHWLCWFCGRDWYGVMDHVCCSVPTVDSDPGPAQVSDADGFWARTAARIAELHAELRRDPAFRREVDWFRYQGVDIEQVLGSAEGRDGFRAGMLYPQRQDEPAALGGQEVPC